jgi:restriction endonuclease Mrr
MGSVPKQPGAQRRTANSQAGYVRFDSKISESFSTAKVVTRRSILRRRQILVTSGKVIIRRSAHTVFITTSAFTKDASEFVEAMPQKIVLITGKELASLMIKHDVGVSPTRTYTLKRLDQDYFDNL